jgi:D-beta-D-heptose 7-phosphate kinase/D-beta-D-heptose 1-phosphate adenosyltransferase
MLLGASGRVIKKIPTAAREIYDVSGAGDTALAALVLALTSGSGLEEAAHFANAAAGVVIAKLGTATVSPEELLDYVSRAS